MCFTAMGSYPANFGNKFRNFSNFQCSHRTKQRTLDFLIETFDPGFPFLSGKWLCSR